VEFIVSFMLVCRSIASSYQSLLEPLNLFFSKYESRFSLFSIGYAIIYNSRGSILVVA
jgi:hypothetical protein